MNKLKERITTIVSNDWFWIIMFGIWLIFHLRVLFDSSYYFVLFGTAIFLTIFFKSKDYALYESLKKSGKITLILLYVHLGLNYAYIQKQEQEIIEAKIVGYSTYSRGSVSFEYRNRTHSRPLRTKPIVEKFGKDFHKTCVVKIVLSRGVWCAFVHKIVVVPKKKIRKKKS
jgi:hypothetical protein